MTYASQVMKDTKGYLSKKEFQRLLSVVDNDRDRLLFLLAVRTGRRVSEIVRSFTPKHINWENRSIRFKILKRRNETWAEQPVSEDTLLRLQKFIGIYKIPEDKPLFPISRQWATKLLKQYGEKAGLTHVGDKPIHFHVFRHTFAVWGARKIKTPGGLRLLQQLLRHSRLETTSFYLQFNPMEERELIEEIEK